jgi:hypothetical protein
MHRYLLPFPYFHEHIIMSARSLGFEDTMAQHIWSAGIEVLLYFAEGNVIIGDMHRKRASGQMHRRGTAPCDQPISVPLCEATMEAPAAVLLH